MISWSKPQRICSKTSYPKLAQVRPNLPFGKVIQSIYKPKWKYLLNQSMVLKHELNKNLPNIFA